MSLTHTDSKLDAFNTHIYYKYLFKLSCQMLLLSEDM